MFHNKFSVFLSLSFSENSIAFINAQLDIMHNKNINFLGNKQIPVKLINIIISDSFFPLFLITLSPIYLLK